MKEDQKTYKEKLKDPRWQKKRLEIFKRDGWCCQKCFDNQSTLHVHHRIYEPDKEPWEYDDDLLVTLCDTCHIDEKNNQHVYLSLTDILRRRFFAEDVHELMEAFHKIIFHASPEIVMSAYAYAIKDPHIQKMLLDKYWAHLGREQDNRRGGKRNG